MIVASLLDRELAFRQTFRYTIQSVAYTLYFSTRWHPQARGPFGGSHRRPLRWIGWTSYSLYLIHESFILKFQSLFGTRLLALGVTSFILAALYAALMRYAVEIPLRKVQSRFAGRDA